MISSAQNETIKRLRKLNMKKYRDESQSFLVEGEHLVEEAKASGLACTTYGVGEGYDVQISEMVAEKLSQTQSGSHCFAEVAKKHDALTKGHRFLLCDGIQDPGNMGTMIRTAHSFGFDAVILNVNCVDEYNDKVIRSTQGSIFYIPVIRMDLKEAIHQLQNQGVVVYATALSDDAVGLQSISDPQCAVIMGSEGSGVSKDLMSISDQRMIIETSQFESLNVAVASAIICYTLRQ